MPRISFKTLLISLGIISTVITAIAQQSPLPKENTEQSPIVSELLKNFQNQDESAVKDFWQKIEKSKTPVVEDSNKPNHSWVTFFYRGGDNVKQVQLNSAITAASVDGLVAEGMDIGIFKRVGNTDIWYYSLILPDKLRTTYRLNVTENSEKKTITEPLNPNIYAPNSPWTESILTLPNASPQPWREYKAEGKWQDIEINSKALGGKSTINVYLPKSWNQSNAKNWNVFIGMDAIGYQDPLVPTDRIIEYLMDKGKIPPTVAVLTQDLSDIGDQSEKGYEPVANFLADEVIPTIREKFGVAAKPTQVIVSGKSRRGMMSAYAAFKRPDAIGKVLSLSGSYYWSPPNQTEYEHIPRLYAESEKKPIKLYLSAGIYEVFVSPRNVGHYLLATNRHMRDVLTAKGYDFKYEEFPATHRELNWEDQLVEGLEFLLSK